MSIKFSRIMCLLPDLHEVYTSQAKGLEMLGATVLLVNYREEVLKLGIYEARKEILKIIESFSPDLVLTSFFFNNYELSPEFLREISTKVYLVINPGDDEVYGTWQTIYFAQSADAVMTCDYAGRYVYEQLSIPTVYFLSPVLDFMDPLPTEKKEFNVSFVGDCEKADRSCYINFLRDNGIDVATFGRGSKNEFVSREEFLNIISKSKINLNFTKTVVPKEILRREPWRANIRQLKARTIETSKMKSFCLSEYSEDLGRVYSIGSEMDVFRDRDELLVKVKYYLKNDAEREDMASRAFDRSKKEYDDLNYLCRTFNLLHEKLHSTEKRVKNSPIFRSFDFDVSEVKGNMFIFIRLLLLGRFVRAFGVAPYFLSLNRSCIVGLWRGLVELTMKVLRCREGRSL